MLYKESVVFCWDLPIQMMVSGTHQSMAVSWYSPEYGCKLVSTNSLSVPLNTFPTISCLQLSSGRWKGVHPSMLTFSNVSKYSMTFRGKLM